MKPAIVCIFLICPLFASNSAKFVTSASKVNDIWTPDQHLYIKGNVGLTRTTLDQLELWLDNKAPN